MPTNSNKFGRVVKATDSNMPILGVWLSVGFARTGSNPVAVEIFVSLSFCSFDNSLVWQDNRGLPH